jgi:hypothetical protein
MVGEIYFASAESLLEGAFLLGCVKVVHLTSSVIIQIRSSVLGTLGILFYLGSLFNHLPSKREYDIPILHKVALPSADILKKTSTTRSVSLII